MRGLRSVCFRSKVLYLIGQLEGRARLVYAKWVLALLLLIKPKCLNLVLASLFDGITL